jgi:hypothetical protein
MSGQNYSWQNLSTERLLELKICDLRLEWKRSAVLPQVGQLRAEILAKKIRFNPKIWVSTEWFSPYGVPGFAVPFYLLHPRLVELEQKYIGEVEGGTPEWCMQLLRHETGHAVDNAFLLRRSKARQKLFGLSGAPYPRRYRPNPQSRQFVRHLPDFYAQAHPDEDWAETFAIWLDPESNWRQAYQGWGALEKLEMVDRLGSGIEGKKPGVNNTLQVDELSTCTQTLGEYWRQKKRKFAPAGKARQTIDAGAKERWIAM